MKRGGGLNTEALDKSKEDIQKRIAQGVDPEDALADAIDAQNAAEATPTLSAPESPAPPIEELGHAIEEVVDAVPSQPKTRSRSKRPQPPVVVPLLAKLIETFDEPKDHQVVRNGKQRLCLYLDQDLMEEMRIIAKTERTTQTAYVTAALKMLNAEMTQRNGGPYTPIK